MKVDKNKILLNISDSCYLRIITKKDVSEDYIFWMNDYEVHKYIEQKNAKHNKKKIEEFVDQKFV